MFYIQQKMFAAGNQAFESCASIYPGNDQILYYYALSLVLYRQTSEVSGNIWFGQAGVRVFEKSILRALRY
ncbi:MAG: hypothetical protein R3A45_01805 [Bdellovibrionota bacterium]